MDECCQEKRKLDPLTEIVIAGITGGALGVLLGIEDGFHNSDVGTLFGAATTAVYPLVIFRNTRNFQEGVNIALVGTPTMTASYFTAYFLTRAAYSFFNQ